MNEGLIGVTPEARQLLVTMFANAKSIADMEPCRVDELRKCLRVYEERVLSFTVLVGGGVPATTSVIPSAPQPKT